MSEKNVGMTFVYFIQYSDEKCPHAYTSVDSNSHVFAPKNFTHLVDLQEIYKPLDIYRKYINECWIYSCQSHKCGKSIYAQSLKEFSWGFRWWRMWQAVYNAVPLGCPAALIRCLWKYTIARYCPFVGVPPCSQVLSIQALNMFTHIEKKKKVCIKAFIVQNLMRTSGIYLIKTDTWEGCE